MLHARFLRSPYAHARLVRVDTSRAEQVPGVVAVFSRNDLVDQERLFPYYGAVIRDQTPVVCMKCGSWATRWRRWPPRPKRSPRRR